MNLSILLTNVYSILNLGFALKCKVCGWGGGHCGEGEEGTSKTCQTACKKYHCGTHNSYLYKIYRSCESPDGSNSSVLDKCESGVGTYYLTTD